MILYNKLFSTEVTDEQRGVPVNVLRLMFDRPPVEEQSALERRFKGFSEGMIYRLDYEQFNMAESQDKAAVKEYAEAKKAEHGRFMRFFGAGDLTKDEAESIKARKAGYDFLYPIFENDEQSIYAQYCRILDNIGLICQTLDLQAVSAPTYQQFSRLSDLHVASLEGYYEKAADLVKQTYQAYVEAAEYVSARYPNVYLESAHDSYRNSFVSANPLLEINGMTDLAMARKNEISARESYAEFMQSMGQDINGLTVEENFARMNVRELEFSTRDEKGKLEGLREYRGLLIQRDGMNDIAKINDTIISMCDSTARDIKQDVESLRRVLESKGSSVTAKA
jgi:hypothetical protein